MSAVKEQPTAVLGRQGQYAGAVTRLVAFVLDVGVSWGIYLVTLGAISFTWTLVTGRSIHFENFHLAYIAAAAVWIFTYFAYQWALGGKTVGMAFVGIRVVSADGSPAQGREAVLRTLALPLSFLLLGLGFLGILINPDRHALHDRLAGTAVVYSWDARAARLRWLAKQEPTGSTSHSGHHRPVR